MRLEPPPSATCARGDRLLWIWLTCETTESYTRAYHSQLNQHQQEALTIMLYNISNTVDKGITEQFKWWDLSCPASRIMNVNTPPMPELLMHLISQCLHKHRRKIQPTGILMQCSYSHFLMRQQPESRKSSKRFQNGASSCIFLKISYRLYTLYLQKAFQPKTKLIH